MPARTKPVVIPSRVPARLRSLVDADGRPQTEIADAAGITKQRLYQVLNATDGANPTVATVGAILIALGRSWTDLD